jgi:formyltetrahydrofolate deformylase
MPAETPSQAAPTSARLLITCPDQPGIIASVTSFLHNHGVNVTRLDEHATAPEGGTLFMRLEFQTPRLEISRPALEQSFADVLARRYQMQWHIAYSSEPKRMAILVSRHDHALLELLWRWSRGELPALVTQVISNHADLEGAVRAFGVPFAHVPFDNDERDHAEGAMRELLGDDTDLVVLARYMRVLSGDFVSAYPERIINIHHSFLPAFAGARPYHQAYAHGVKIIGATAHYVTAELDAGPIIEQDVARASHRDTVGVLQARGRDLERQVLARAVRWHLEDRIIVHGNKTVVFD